MNEKKQQKEIKNKIRDLKKHLQEMQESLQQEKFSFVDYMIQNNHFDEQVESGKEQELIETISKKEMELLNIKAEIEDLNYQFYKPFLSLLKEKEIELEDFKYLMEINALFKKKEIVKTKYNLKEFEKLLDDETLKRKKISSKKEKQGEELDGTKQKNIADEFLKEETECENKKIEIEK